MSEDGLRPPKTAAYYCGYMRTMGRQTPKLPVLCEAISLSSKNKAVQVATFMSCIDCDAQQIFKTFALGADEKITYRSSKKNSRDTSLRK